MNGMYKFDNGQISLEDFGQPVGMNLKNSNRWVKRAQTIPWIEIEKKYGIETNHEDVIMSPVSGCHNGPWLAAYGIIFLRREDEELASGV